MKFRNYAIFFDGTWNDHSSETNVWQLFQDLRRGDYRFKDEPDDFSTEAYYLSGPGTSADMSVVGGAFAKDLGDAIVDAYAWVCEKLINLHNANEDSEPLLYLFGFSRGAYRAHMFSWALNDLGIVLDYAKARELARNWCEHNDECVESLLSQVRTMSAPKIKMLGVWDVVSAPLDRHKHYKDGICAPLVEHLYHAMAAHERRVNFPVMKYPASEQMVEQVWFPGAHSDVGGGYPLKERCLSDVCLSWMKCHAFKLGLDFVHLPKKPPETLKASDIVKWHDEAICISKWFSLYNRSFEEGESCHPILTSLMGQDKKYKPCLKGFAH